MADSASAHDEIMSRITASVIKGRAGDSESALVELLSIWDGIGVGGDPFHRCTLAHYLADLFEHPAQALMWDVRALDAADEFTDQRARQFESSLQVAAFYPSLHLNIADNLRRLSAFDSAQEHIDAARRASSSLGDDDYGRFIKSSIDSVESDISNRSTACRNSAP